MTAITLDPTRLAEITSLHEGAHAADSDKRCLMEAVAYVRGIRHTDHPACVSPVLGGMGRQLNDALPDGVRDALIALIPDLPGTAGDGHDEARSYMALDWLIRTWLPAWLDLVPSCRDEAARIRAVGQIVDRASAERAAPAVRQGRSSAAAAWAAARDAARDTAGAAAAGAAAGAAARDTAVAAAWAAARVAARAALKPTVDRLQRSAVDLYARMTRIGQ